MKLYVALAASLASSVAAHDSFGASQQYAGPEDQSPEAFTAWHADYVSWRSETAANLDLSNYDLPSVQSWRTSFIQPQLMMHDLSLFDRSSSTWTVDKYLEDVTSRYGGIDSVLIWPTYPNIGVDDRNQYDMHSSLPGGIESLKELVDDFHAHDVKVLLPLNPWDHGTSDSGLANYQALIELIQATGADGFNGDTMDGVNASYWDEALPNYPIVIEPETMYPDQAYNDENDLETNLWSWGYWGYETSPSVSVYKALTGGRHLTHICERWAMDHTDGIQHAFFNGAGFESWENVWGIWNGITERDSALLKRASSILRAFGDLVQGGDPDFIPHIPVAPEKSFVYATQFANETHKVFLLVNRNAFDAADMELQLPCRLPSPPPSSSAASAPSNYTKLAHANCYAGHGATDLEVPIGSFAAGATTVNECAALCDSTDGCSSFTFGNGRCYRRADLYSRTCDQSAEFDTYASSTGDYAKVQITDLYAGTALDDAVCDLETGIASVTTTIEAGGIGAIMIDSSAGLDDFTSDFLQTMHAMTHEQPLSDLSADWVPLQQTMTVAPAPSTDADPSLRGPTVDVPATSEFWFEVYGNCLEGDLLPDAIDVQFEWEDTPRREHGQTVEIPALVFDKYTVSNAEYKAFLDATGWVPATTQNWLRDWDEEYIVPEGYESKPVTWVSRDDAVAYCAAVGARLPTSYEWQYAAQGLDERAHPWGNVKDASKVPKFTTGRNMPAPDDRDAHPDGASPFGLEDLVGNVYQWTDQFTDEHTSRAILRGGSRWYPEGSDWYLPQPESLNYHDTFLLLSDSMDRSAGIGFRCVSDGETSAN